MTAVETAPELRDGRGRAWRPIVLAFGLIVTAAAVMVFSDLVGAIGPFDRAKIQAFDVAALVLAVPGAAAIALRRLPPAVGTVVTVALAGLAAVLVGVPWVAQELVRCELAGLPWAGGSSVPTSATVFLSFVAATTAATVCGGTRLRTFATGAAVLAAGLVAAVLVFGATQPVCLVRPGPT